MMLAYLPFFYPSELLYSILARTYRHGGWCSPKQGMVEFFGSHKTRAGTFLQTDLNRFAKRLPSNRRLTSVQLAHDATLLPYLTAFQPAEIRAWSLAAVCGDNGKADAVYAKLGLATSRVHLPSVLRYCPICRTEMLEKLGELYWVRDHQLPGVLVCHLHAVALADSQIILAETGQHEFIAADEDNCPAHPSTPIWQEQKATVGLLQQIALDSTHILSSPPKPQPLQDWGQQYRLSLQTRGFGRGASQIDQPAIQDAYLARFHRVMEILPEAAPDGWLESITRKHRKSFAPLHHILVQQLIDAYPRKSVVKPFGCGPWLCRNPLANHFGQPVVSDCHLNDDHRKTIGVFRCTCGFAYCVAVDPESKIRVLDRGPLFEHRLRELTRTPTSLRKLAKELCVDVNTVLHYITKFGLETPWKSRPMRMKSPPIDRIAMRDTWQNAHSASPDLTRQALRRLIPAVYAWLYRHDRDWLKVQGPAPVRLPPRCFRIDWARLDAATAEILQREAQRLKLQIPPIAVTRAALERALGRRGWLEKRLDKLPICADLLQNLVESKEGFQCRRIDWASDRLCFQGLPIRVWRLRRLAGLPPHGMARVEISLLRAEERAAL